MTDRTLMRAEQPTLQQRYHLMDLRQQMLAFRLMPLNLLGMSVTVHLQIRKQTVRLDRAARLDRILDETVKTLAARVGDVSHTNQTTENASLSSTALVLGRRLCRRRSGGNVPTALCVQNG